MSREYLRINEPKALSSFIFCETLFHEKFDNLACNSHTRTPCAHEHCPLILHRFPSLFEGIYNARKNDGACSLDIVVEARVSIFITLERWERILEIFELDDNPFKVRTLTKVELKQNHLPWPNFVQRKHQLVEIFSLLLFGKSLLSCAHVQWVIAKCLIVCSKI